MALNIFGIVCLPDAKYVKVLLGLEHQHQIVSSASISNCLTFQINGENMVIGNTQALVLHYSLVVGDRLLQNADCNILGLIGLVKPPLVSYLTCTCYGTNTQQVTNGQCPRDHQSHLES